MCRSLLSLEEVKCNNDNENRVTFYATAVIRRPSVAGPDLFLANIDNFYRLHKEVLVALVRTRRVAGDDEEMQRFVPHRVVVATQQVIPSKYVSAQRRRRMHRIASVNMQRGRPTYIPRLHNLLKHC